MVSAMLAIFVANLVSTLVEYVTRDQTAGPEEEDK